MVFSTMFKRSAPNSKNFIFIKNMTRWLFSTNAKDIGTLYLMFAVFAGMIGTAFSVIIRLELSAPGVQFLEGDHQLFNVVITAHAIVMIFFMVMPALVGGFGNYMLPVLIGAPDCFHEKIKNIKSNIIKFVPLTSINLMRSKVSGGKKDQASSNGFSMPSYFPSYLAGLFESIGRVKFSKVHNYGNKINYPFSIIPYIVFYFDKKDVPFIKVLISLFGGSLSFKNDNKALWIISRQEELINLVNVMNGYLKTPKIMEFNKLITWLNDRFNFKFTLHSLNKNGLKTNGWLAGFIDGIGIFEIILNEIDSNLKLKTILAKDILQISFMIEQKQYLNFTDTSEKFSFRPVMLEILYFLKHHSDLKQSRHSRIPYWKVKSGSLNNLSNLVEYLNTYSLHTIKQNKYKLWLKTYNLLVNNEHITKKELTLIKKEFKLN